MSRNRTPTEVLERRGSFDHDPARGKARAAEPLGLAALGAPPPEFLNDKSPTALANLRAWNEFVEETAAIRIDNRHRALFEEMSRMRAESRRRALKSSERNAYLAFLRQTGITPASSSLVNGNGVNTSAEEQDEWEEAANGGTGLPIQ